MAFLSGFFTVAGAVGQVAKAFNWVMRKLELAGAYVSGWMRSQRVHQEAADDDLQDVRDDREEAGHETRDDLIDALADDGPDGMLDPDGVSGDPEAGDHSEHEV